MDIFLSSRTSKHAYHALNFIPQLSVGWWHDVRLREKTFFLAQYIYFIVYIVYMWIHSPLIVYVKYLCQQALYWFDKKRYTQCVRKFLYNKLQYFCTTHTYKTIATDKFGMFQQEWQLTDTPACVMRIAYDSWIWHKYIHHQRHSLATHSSKQSLIFHTVHNTQPHKSNVYRI